MAITDRPKKRTSAPARPKSARVDPAFDSSLEEWLAEITAIAAAEKTETTFEHRLPHLEPEHTPLAPLVETEGEAPVIGDVCELPESVVPHPGVAAFIPEPAEAPEEPAEDTPQTADVPEPPADRAIVRNAPRSHPAVRKPRALPEDDPLRDIPMEPVRGRPAVRKPLKVGAAVTAPRIVDAPVAEPAAEQATGVPVLPLESITVVPEPVEAPPRRRLSTRRKLINVGIAVAAVAVSAALVVLGTPGPTGVAPVAAPSADPTVAEAQRWVAANIAPGDRVVVDDDLSAGLVGAGFSSEGILPLSLLAADADPDAWRSVDFVLSTDAVRAETDPDVAAALAASTVVASFGGGAVDVLQVHEQGLGPLASAEASATASRAALGVQLAANPGLTLSAPAAELLRSGQVDARIVILLGEALADHNLFVNDFPSGVGEPDGIRHRILFASYDGVSAASDATALTAWLQGLDAPYAPVAIGVDDTGLVATLSLGDPTEVLPTR